MGELHKLSLFGIIDNIVPLLTMTEQQEHLKEVLRQQSELLQQIQNLNNELTSKRELALKLQGVIEYLQQIGVSLEETATIEE
jgi:hypothetical protein